MQYQVSAIPMSVPCVCHINAMPMPCQCHGGAMPMPSRNHLPCQCHIRAKSALSVPFHRYVCHVIAMPMLGQCHVSLPSLVPCQCNANAMSMPRQCHVSARSMPCQCHVMPRHCALMAHTILAVPYLKPNRGWASPCPTCISNTINHTKPCECHVRAKRA